MNIMQKFSSPEHHQTMGAVERANQTLIHKLKKLTDNGRLSWEKALVNATFAVNISYHRALGTSPYIFKFGKEPKFEVDTVFNTEHKHIDHQKIIERQREIFDKYSKKYIQKGKKVCTDSYEIGDKVLIFRQTLQNKFSTGWKPGFTIKQKINEDAYEVADKKITIRVNKKHIIKDTSLS